MFRVFQLRAASFAPASQNGTAGALPDLAQAVEAQAGACVQSAFSGGSFRTNAPVPSSPTRLRVASDPAVGRSWRNTLSHLLSQSRSPAPPGVQPFTNSE